MAKNRIVGLDLVKGIAIFMMIIVHAVTQVIADYDGSIFLTIVDKIPKVVLYCVVYPLVIIGLWGTVFTVVTAMTTTLSTLRILETNKRAIGMYLIQRWLFLVLLRSAEAFLTSVLNEKYDIFNNSVIVIPPVAIAGPATTLDAIGWGGLIAPILVWLTYSFLKNKSKWWMITLYTIIVFSLFAVSPFSESLFALLSKKSYEHKLGLFGDIFGKIALGRFKIAQTCAFAAVGTLYGHLIYHGETVRFQYFLGSFYFVVCIIIFAVWCVVSPSFLDHIVDEDVPLPAQILSLGCECFFIYVHVYFVDGARDNARKLKSRKRCTYLFRLGMLSLTVFCIGSWVGKQLSLPWQLFFGPPCAHNPPQLLWNLWVCIAFTIFVLFVWIGISLLWEKIDFKFSLEHILLWSMAKVVGKEYIPNSRKFVYGPAEELEEGSDMRFIMIYRNEGEPFKGFNNCGFHCLLIYEQ